jgi:hypothetical protein
MILRHVHISAPPSCHINRDEAGRFPTLARTMWIFCALLLVRHSLSAQAVSEIITDYNGYWKSSSSQINAVKPDNHHNLLAFSFNGQRYSTGVNDALLTSRGDAFVAGSFRALPLNDVNPPVNGNTKIGLGSMADGVANGPSNPPPSRNIPTYLGDGVNGLNLGSCIANLPAGTLMLSVSNLRPEMVGDGIPDILVTQVADPSSSYDRYEFTDVNGTRVGNYKDILLTNITPIGNWMADFYEATGSTILGSGFTNTQRSFRLWAADFSAFGITAADLPHIAYFRIGLSGNSDLAFVAYNNNSIQIEQILSGGFTSFTAQPIGDQVSLEWTVAGSQIGSKFLVEKSTDGINFEVVDSVNHNAYTTYNYLLRGENEGLAYYRIIEKTAAGNTSYSNVQRVAFNRRMVLTAFPNPAHEFLHLKYSLTTDPVIVTVTNSNGLLAKRETLKAAGGVIKMNIAGLTPGNYFIVVNHGAQRQSCSVVVR